MRALTSVVAVTRAIDTTEIVITHLLITSISKVACVARANTIIEVTLAMHTARYAIFCAQVFVAFFSEVSVITHA